MDPSNFCISEIGMSASATADSIAGMKSSSALFDPESASTLALVDITEFSAHGIVSRALLTGPTLRMTLFGFAAGQELSEHASPRRAVIHILSGSSQWTIDGKKQEIRAGQILHLPPGVPHAVLAAEPFSMLLILIKEDAATDKTNP